MTWRVEIRDEWRVAAAGFESVEDAEVAAQDARSSTAIGPVRVVEEEGDE